MDVDTLEFRLPWSSDEAMTDLGHVIAVANGNNVHRIFKTDF